MHPKQLTLPVTTDLRGCNSTLCGSCPNFPEHTLRHGLMWVSSKDYRLPHLFVAEAQRRGVSVKIPATIRKFELGYTWVYLAHKCAVSSGSTPGIFAWFLPTSIDLVVTNRSFIPDRARRLRDKLGPAARLVQVIPQSDTQGELFAHG